METSSSSPTMTNKHSQSASATATPLTRIILLSSFLILAFCYYLGSTPTHVEPYSFRYADSLPHLSHNSRLKDHAEIFFRGELKAPEHYAFNVRDGFIYISSYGDGRIVRTLPREDGTLGPLETLVHMGDPAAAEAAGTPCGTEAGEFICGRPAGMEFNAQGKLIVIDGVHGLIEIDVETKTKTLLATGTNGYHKFLNALAIGPVTGKYYLTDSSTRWQPQDIIYEILDSSPTGQLLEYDPVTKQTRTLCDQIAFANGLLIDKEETYILMAEMNRAAILKYDLKKGEEWRSKHNGEQPHWAQVRQPSHANAASLSSSSPSSLSYPISILLDNMVGVPDNLAWELSLDDPTQPSYTHFWVGCGTTRPAPFSLMDFVSNKTPIRQVLAIIIPKWFFVHLAPKMGIAVRVEMQTDRENAELLHASAIETLQDLSGFHLQVTGAYEHGGYLYFGSISSEIEYVSRVPWTRENKTSTEWRGK